MFTSRRIATMGGDKFRDDFSLEFDGTNDYLDCGPSNALVTGNNVTFSCWAKVTDTDRGYIFSNARDNTSSNFSLQVNRDGASGDTAGYITAIVYTGSVTAYTIYDGNINDSQWHHYALTTTASAQVLYLDGVAVATTSNTFSNSAAANYNTLIGNLIGTSNYFGGNISEVALYNSTLSASQVKTLYNGREPYNHKEGIASGNLKAWWRMGDGRLDGAGQVGNLSNDDSSQDNIISDEVDSTLGPELYTHANSLSTNEADDQSTGLNVLGGVTLSDETSITNNSSRSLTYTADSNADGFYIDLTSDVDLTPGEVYRISVDVRHTGSGGTHQIRVSETTSSTGETLVLRTLTSGSANFKTCTAYFIHNDTTTRYFISRETGNDEDGGVYLDNLSIKKVNGYAAIINNKPAANADFEGDTP